MRCLVPAAIRGLATIALEQRIELLHHLAFRRVAQQLQSHRGEGAIESVGASQRLFRHPDDTEAAVIGHDVARSDRIDELGRKPDADNNQLSLAPV